MNLYTTNNLNNTTAMLFNGVGNEYYNYNLGGCGCSGLNIGNWLNGTLMGNMFGYNSGCGCGNAGLGYTIMSSLLNALMVCGAGMITGSRANKAAKAAEEKTLRQNFDKALETLGLNDKSDAQLLQMSDADIDAIEIDSDYDDVTLQGVRDSITALKGEIETSKKTTEVNLKNTYEGYNKTWKAMPETTTDEKTAKEAYYKNTVKPAYEAWQAQVKARGEQEKELKELEKQEKTIIEKQTAFRNAKKTVKDYITKTLKPAQEKNDNQQITTPPQSNTLTGNRVGNGKIDYTTITNSSGKSLQDLIDAFHDLPKSNGNVDLTKTEQITAFRLFASSFTEEQLRMINTENARDVKEFLQNSEEAINDMRNGNRPSLGA